ncbi:MAG TPA: AmmeMemoRadiSam system radical SAM enzyme [Bryobacteraceae bacterium]|nr:AmmeMemoRadiSam system radical SAM enzyme [Bryobacteraceae bacterium]
MKTLAEELTERTRESGLFEVIDGYRLRCLACGHRCPIPAGFSGVCKVRFNRGGKLYAPYGYVNTIQCDPLEKKPFYHVRPGGFALSFGMLGCDLHCGYCQNWVTSQALRDVRSTLDFAPVRPEQIVNAAVAHGADAVVSTYNEPLITAEWAVEIFRVARRAGLLTGFVSNGNATPEVLRYLRPWLDLYKVDLKSFNNSRYRELGGRLGPILDSIQLIHEMGFWLEIVTLVVPGFNDSDQEIESIARFLAGISPDIPWHVIAFHKDYRMTSPENTSPTSLLRAARIGREAGLHFVYAGNLPGAVGSWEDTLCPACGTAVIRRRGFRILEDRVGEGGVCPQCRVRIPGVWIRPGICADGGVPLVHVKCG